MVTAVSCCIEAAEPRHWELLGGYALVEQVMVRRELTRRGVAPLPLRPFLDYAVGCSLLRQVGDSYLFVHLSLREYFAAMWLDHDVPDALSTTCPPRAKSDPHGIIEASSRTVGYREQLPPDGLIYSPSTQHGGPPTAPPRADHFSHPRTRLRAPTSG
ncbi:MAG: hypothetical protein M3228_10250 [Actinomycetota bacterium]|nr:hypothetical protein [Actinomycetota bacterium]